MMKSIKSGKRYAKSCKVHFLLWKASTLSQHCLMSHLKSDKYRVCTPVADELGSPLAGWLPGWYAATRDPPTPQGSHPILFGLSQLCLLRLLHAWHCLVVTYDPATTCLAPLPSVLSPADLITALTYSQWITRYRNQKLLDLLFHKMINQFNVQMFQFSVSSARVLVVNINGLSLVFLFDWWVHVTSWNAIHTMIESAQNSPVPDSLLCKGASGPRLAMTGRQLMFQDTKRHYRPCGSGLQWKQFKSHYRPCIKYRAPRKQNGPCSTKYQRTLRDTFCALCETLWDTFLCTKHSPRFLYCLRVEQSSISSVLSPWHLCLALTHRLGVAADKLWHLYLSRSVLQSLCDTMRQSARRLDDTRLVLLVLPSVLLRFFLYPVSALLSPPSQQLCLAQCLLPSLSSQTHHEKVHLVSK